MSVTELPRKKCWIIIYWFTVTKFLLLLPSDTSSLISIDKIMSTDVVQDWVLEVAPLLPLRIWKHIPSCVTKYKFILIFSCSSPQIMILPKWIWLWNLRYMPNILAIRRLRRMNFNFILSWENLRSELNNDPPKIFLF